jgi:hypothetical protein
MFDDDRIDRDIPMRTDLEPEKPIVVRDAQRRKGFVSMNTETGRISPRSQSSSPSATATQSSMAHKAGARSVHESPAS